MAKRLKFKLPPLRMTQRSTSGEVSHGFIPRACRSLRGTEQIERNEEQPSGVVSGASLNVGNWMEASDHLPSLHEITQKQATESWNKIRPELLKVAIASEALPKNRQCSCCIEEASCRCLQCGPNIFYCKTCFEEAHRRANIFHTGETWQVLTLVV